MNEETLKTISKNLHTQDNRITEHPVFCVQEKMKDYGYSSDHSDDYDWYDSDIADMVGDEKAELLDELDDKGVDLPDCYEKAYYQERWETDQFFFTEAGANDYIKSNGHNLGEKRIWVDSAYRNYEFQAVREYLMNLTEGETDNE